MFGIYGRHGYICGMLIKESCGYSISISGIVTNKDGQEIKQVLYTVRGRQYYVVSLQCGSEFNRINKVFMVHRLVAQYWQSAPASPSMVVRHKDGNTLNNKSFNLEWITRQQISRKPRNGKPHSKETKQAISEAMKGQNHPKYSGYFVCNFKRYDSATQAAKAFKVTAATVINRCKKQLLEGWYFVPVRKD